MKKQTILVVDDELRVARLIQANLEAGGYAVSCAYDGSEAVRKAAVENPDLIILDIILPGEFDGYDVCRRIRSFSGVPIIMLTAKALEKDKVRGFEAGADDYLTKPFGSQELLSRVKAVLRRAGGEQQKGLQAQGSASLKCDALEIDFVQASVVRSGRKVKLTPTEFRLLSELARYPNQLISHEDLLTRVWGPEYRDERDYLRAYIWHLRKKIEEDPSKPKFILSRTGLGYMLKFPLC
ncbi:MAG: response regulator transcription factor [Firmicutes bacterium]|nr:response regulator transcription factor [Bacillota bacterium]